MNSITVHDRKIVAIFIGFIHSKFAIRLFKIIRFCFRRKKNRKNILKNKWNHKFMLALMLLVGELKNKYFYSFTKFLMKISKIEKDVRASQVI